MQRGSAKKSGEVGDSRVESSCVGLCWLLRLSVPKMTGADYLGHPLVNEVLQVASCVNLYFKLPGGNNQSYT